MYTINAAYAANLEKTKGSIEPGKDADFAVVNMDPYKCSDKDEIYELAAEMTIKKRSGYLFKDE